MRTLKATAAVATLSLTLASTQVLAEMQTKTVEYKIGETTFTGYMAWDDEFEEKRPGVLVVHEWWGHNEFARDQAERLAASGYTAFALDMYGSGKLADHPDTAQKFMQEATKDIDQVKARFLKAMEILQNHESVDASRIAAQGYCFGGAVVLNMARMGVDLDGVVSYHGALGSPIRDSQGSGIYRWRRQDGSLRAGRRSGKRDAGRGSRPHAGQFPGSPALIYQSWC